MNLQLPCKYFRVVAGNSSHLLISQDYCASKFAAVGFHESLAHELLAEEVEGVKTTLVCPYIVNTGMFEGCKIR